MNRKVYFDVIKNNLGMLAYSIELCGGLNLLDVHLHSEDFYLHFINLLFGWQLENLNAVQHNAAGIDLVDTTNRIVAQVSATATKHKVESALAKDLSGYEGYSFQFISISKDAAKLRTQTFRNPHKLVFEPTQDIHDVTSLLNLCKNMDMAKMQEVYEFLKRELKSDPDPEKVESNIAAIINVLSKEDWNQGASRYETAPYDIEAKISYNQLDAARVIIDDHKIHCYRIDRIYSDFDKQGVNKSLSVLNSIRAEYAAIGAMGTPDDLFFAIIEKVTGKIRDSANYTPIPEEELSLCVQIIVVDAFTRCKIFENPLGNADARS